jgi:Ion channel
MRTVVIVGGGVLITVAIADIFTTVLHYEHRGLLTPRLHRLVWVVMRSVARPFHGTSHTYMLSLGAPVMMVATLALWMTLLVCGFALVYQHAMASGSLELAPHLAPTFVTAVYFSAVTLSTLGFGDVTPVSSSYQLVAVVEALSGLGLATMTISYILNVYRELHRLNTLAGALEEQFPARGDPTDVLAPHFNDGRPCELSTRLHDLYLDLLAYAEGLHQYPLVYYFHSGRRFRSLPYSFHIIGQLIAALRWGLPADHPAATNPWLVALVGSYLHIAEYVERHFTGTPMAHAPPLDREAFVARLSGGADTCDETVQRFIDLTRHMERVTGVHDASTAEALYARYRGWLAFSQRASGFVRATARDLAYDMDALRLTPDWLLASEPSP